MRLTVTVFCQRESADSSQNSRSVSLISIALEQSRKLFQSCESCVHLIAFARKLLPFLRRKWKQFSIQTLQGYIFNTLCHFATTKLCHFTNFTMLFVAVMFELLFFPNRLKFNFVDANCPFLFKM